MGRYNKKVDETANMVTNHQGGMGYKLDPKFELIGILTTGLDNSYYESLGERETRFVELIKQIAKTDIEFIAKALVYTRSVVGQRTVTHLGSVAAAPFLSGMSLGKNFFSKRSRKHNSGGIIYRLDDMLEIAAAYMTLNPGKSLPNSMKRGFKSAIENSDAYTLAKYQGKGKMVSLVDIFNLVHPVPQTDEMSEVFNKLMTGNLKQFNTVEDANTESGKKIADKLKKGEITEAEAAIELVEEKSQNYKELILSKKIGYLALIRNLRNILKGNYDSELVNAIVCILTDAITIKRSLVFPHQIDLSLEVLLSESIHVPKKILTALNTAYELAIPNLTELFTHGRTAVIFDSSGSMSSPIALANRSQGSESRIGKASLIAATLAKGIGADVYHFADYCQEIKFNPTDSVNTLKNLFKSKQDSVGWGTAFNSIIKQTSGKYDRIFVISDMQGADSLKHGSYQNMHIYSINIAGYGTTMFKPGSKVYSIFGYGSDIYELIKKVEIDPNAILTEINAIQI